MEDGASHGNQGVVSPPYEESKFTFIKEGKDIGNT